MTNEQSRGYAPFLAAFGVVVFWSSAFPAVKYCLNDYSPESIMLLRFLVASVALLIYTGCFAKEKLAMPRGKDLGLLVLGGVVGIFLYMWAFNTGTKMVSSGVSSLIISFVPVITMGLSMAMLGEKPTALNVTGITVSFLGLLLIVFSQGHGFELNLGAIILIGAAVCMSLYNILQRKLLKRYSAIQTTTYCVVSATALMLVFLPKLIAEFPKAPLTTNLLIVYLGLFPAALSYFLWSYALSKAKKTLHVTNFQYLTPFLSIILAYFWLGEKITPPELIGGLIIVAGVIVSSLKLRREAEH